MSDMFFFLSDFGAEVVRVDRVGASSQDTLARGWGMVFLFYFFLLFISDFVM